MWIGLLYQPEEFRREEEKLFFLRNTLIPAVVERKVHDLDLKGLGLKPGSTLLCDLKQVWVFLSLLYNF